MDRELDILVAEALAANFGGDFDARLKVHFDRYQLFARILRDLLDAIDQNNE